MCVKFRSTFTLDLKPKWSTSYTLWLIWKTPWKFSELLSTEVQRDMVMTSLNKQIYRKEWASLSSQAHPVAALILRHEEMYWASLDLPSSLGTANGHFQWGKVIIPHHQCQSCEQNPFIASLATGKLICYCSQLTGTWDGVWWESWISGKPGLRAYDS